MSTASLARTQARSRGAHARPSGRAGAVASRRARTRFLVAIFGSTERDGRIRVGRRIACLLGFGNIDLDLRQASTEQDVITIFAFGIFGAIDVYVPEGVEVDLHGLVVFGHKGAHGNDPPPHPGDAARPASTRSRSSPASTSGASPSPGRRRPGARSSEASAPETTRSWKRELRRRDRRRRLSRLRPCESSQRGSVDACARARGGPSRLHLGPVHPHAGGARLPDREQALRLDVRVRARAVHERAARVPRARQGARRLEQHQRDDLPAREPARLRALGGRRRHGELGLPALPAVLQAHGDLPRGRGRVSRRGRPARARARAGRDAALRRLLRGCAAGGLPADERRERAAAGGLREVRPDDPPRPASQRGTGVSAPGQLTAEPRGALPHVRRSRSSSRGRAQSASRSAAR